jgi:hypothetical protein
MIKNIKNNNMIRKQFKSKKYKKYADGGATLNQQENIDTGFDWGNVGTGALSGLSAGAMTGNPIVMAATTAIGAGVGAWKSGVQQAGQLHQNDLINRSNMRNRMAYDRSVYDNYKQGISTASNFNYYAKGGKIDKYKNLARHTPKDLKTGMPTQQLKADVGYHITPNNTNNVPYNARYMYPNITNPRLKEAALRSNIMSNAKVMAIGSSLPMIPLNGLGAANLLYQYNNFADNLTHKGFDGVFRGTNVDNYKAEPQRYQTGGKVDNDGIKRGYNAGSQPTYSQIHNRNKRKGYNWANTLNDTVAAQNNVNPANANIPNVNSNTTRFNFPVGGMNFPNASNPEGEAGNLQRTVTLPATSFNILMDAAGRAINGVIPGTDENKQLVSNPAAYLKGFKKDYDKRTKTWATGNRQELKNEMDEGLVDAVTLATFDGLFKLGGKGVNAYLRSHPESAKALYEYASKIGVELPKPNAKLGSRSTVNFNEFTPKVKNGKPVYNKAKQLEGSFKTIPTNMGKGNNMLKGSYINNKTQLKNFVAKEVKGGEGYSGRSSRQYYNDIIKPKVNKLGVIGRARYNTYEKWLRSGKTPVADLARYNETVKPKVNVNNLNSPLSGTPISLKTGELNKLQGYPVAQDITTTKTHWPPIQSHAKALKKVLDDSRRREYKQIEEPKIKAKKEAAKAKRIANKQKKTNSKLIDSFGFDKIGRKNTSTKANTPISRYLKTTTEEARKLKNRQRGLKAAETRRKNKELAAIKSANKKPELVINSNARALGTGYNMQGVDINRSRISPEHYSEKSPFMQSQYQSNNIPKGKLNRHISPEQVQVSENPSISDYNKWLSNVKNLELDPKDAKAFYDRHNEPNNEAFINWWGNILKDKTKANQVKYMISKGFAKGGMVINSPTKKVGVGIQVNTNKKGTDTINAKVNGKPIKLDNKEIIVQYQGSPVVISDDLGEATKYRQELAMGGNPQQIADKYAMRAMALNPNPDSHAANGWYDGELLKRLEGYRNNKARTYTNNIINPNSYNKFNPYLEVNKSILKPQISSALPSFTPNVNTSNENINPNVATNIPNIYNRNKGFNISTPTLYKPNMYNDIVSTNGVFNPNAYTDNGKKSGDTNNNFDQYSSDNKIGIAQAANYAANVVGNIAAITRLNKTDYPTFKASQPVLQNVDANRTIFDNRKNEINSTFRNVGNQILANTNNSNIAMNRLSGLNASNIAATDKVNSMQVANRSNIGNQNSRIQGRHNLYNAAGLNRHNQAAYQDKVGRINTTNALVGSSTSMLDGIIRNMKKDKYQNEYLEAMGKMYGLNITDPNFSIDSLDEASRARLAELLKPYLK